MDRNVIVFTGRDRIDYGFRAKLPRSRGDQASIAGDAFPAAQSMEIPQEPPKPVIIIIPAKQASRRKLRVAAYCRVSTTMDCQEGSIQAQRNHYENLMAGNPEWESAGVYMEIGISGTKAEPRPALQRMISDCRRGRIQLILTKSISRFARNTADCLQLVREMADLGVEIWFEKEGIHTGTMESEFMLSILACMAENESRSLSDNMKWGVRKRFRAGTYRAKEAPYGYRREGLDFVILPEEAEIVREIYRLYLEGNGIRKITTELNRRGIPSRRGLAWQGTSVTNILHNQVYTGDLLYQRSYMDEQYRQRKNHGELAQYLIRNHHEAIISRDSFLIVQHELVRRRKG